MPGQIPGGADNTAKEPVDVPNGKTVLPSKYKVLTSMEELIHQFILVTEGINAPPGEVYFARKIPRANWVFTSTARAAARPTA
jgi:NADH-quinone oxidoreductase subunit D